MEHPRIESGVKLFSRINSEHVQILDGIFPELLPNGGPFADEILEVLYDDVATFNAFLTETVARSVLPSSGIDRRFKDCQIIFLNTEFRIDIVEIIKALESKLGPSRKSLVETALQNLIVCDCYSLEQLLVTFHNLERIIKKLKRPGLVVLDNSLSHYWAKRAEKTMLSMNEHSVSIVEGLYKKIQDLNVALLYGRPNSSETIKRSKSVGHCIVLASQDERKYLAEVTDFEKNTNHSVTFEVNAGLVFT